MTPLLDLLRDDYEAAGCHTVDTDDGFQTLCPVCRQHTIITVPGDDYRLVEIVCGGGCTRLQIGEELHRLSTQFKPQAATGAPLGAAYNGNGNGYHANGHRGLFTTRGADLALIRPTRFLWRPYLVESRLNLLVGEEGSGKSTVEMWIAARATRGELNGTVVRVLFVGADEDSWHEVTVPRLFALKADLKLVDDFIALDEHSIFDVDQHASELSRVLEAGRHGLVVFEQLMDVLPAMRNTTDPAEVRRVLRPLRHVLAAREATGLGTLHVNKAQLEKLRQRQQGSVQFGALSRSTMFVGRHPSEKGRRVAVLGKRNYVAEDEAAAFSFQIASSKFSLNGEAFDVSRVQDIRQEDMTIEQALTAGGQEPRPRERVRDDLLRVINEGGCQVSTLKGVTPDTPTPDAAQAEGSEGCQGGVAPGDTLTPPAWTTADLARALDRDAKDHTVRRALDDLAEEGVITRGDDKLWRRTPTLFDEEEAEE